MENIDLESIVGGKKIVSFVPVDAIGIKERSSFFTKRSIKTKAKREALYWVIRMMDLTTLEGADTPSRVRQLCQKAKHPAPNLLFEQFKNVDGFESLPSVAAICVYPAMVKTAVKALEGTDIHVASVATGFPAGQLSLESRLKDTKEAVQAGADEIDMVISRGAFLSGDYQRVFHEIEKVKEACGEAHLKVILETGEIGSLDQVRLASDIAIAAGADFIKTSTGKIPQAASLEVTLVMLQAIRDHYVKTGKRIGMKPAGGIRTSKQALHYLAMVKETLGPDWLTPNLFRFGASSLLNDVLRQIYKSYTGRYYYDRAFSLD